MAGGGALNDDELRAYLALTQVPGIGLARLRTLLDACSTAIGGHSAPFEFLCALPGISRALAGDLKSMPLAAGDKILEDVHRVGAEVLIPADERYPALLRDIPEPPPVLFAVGDLGLLRHPCVAIVGSRDHSTYGAEVCRAVAAAAAQAGIVVVSGMARGLDAVAHSAALDCGGSRWECWATGTV